MVQHLDSQTDDTSSVPYEENMGGGEDLRFHHIVPGHPGNEEIDDESHPDIPVFDLNQQLMASHRRRAASRRKGPGKHRATPVAGMPKHEHSNETHEHGPRPLIFESHPLISALVQRDIERLCQGGIVN